MTLLLLDTHAWAWLLTASPRLSARSIEAVESASAVYVSPISFFEIGQKVRLGKWPEMESLAPQLSELLRQQGGRIAELSDEICLRAGTLDWPHRDPFDRILAATAIVSNLSLLSADAVFDGIRPTTGWRGRTW